MHRLYLLSPRETARTELQVWKGYYTQDNKLINSYLKKMLENHYAVPDATKILTLFTKAMTVFHKVSAQPSQQLYELKVLPILLETFKEIKKTSYCQFDIELVAKKELEWWSSRFLGPKSPERVGKIMSEFYALFYGGEARQYEKAAYFRAYAAHYRDLCESSFIQGLTEADWDIFLMNLVHSYENLYDVLFNNYKERQRAI